MLAYKILSNIRSALGVHSARHLSIAQLSGLKSNNILKPEEIATFDSKPKHRHSTLVSGTASNWETRDYIDIGVARNLTNICELEKINIDGSFDAFKETVDPSTLQNVANIATHCYQLHQTMLEIRNFNQRKFEPLLHALLDLSGVKINNGFLLNPAVMLPKLSVLNGNGEIGLFADTLVSVSERYSSGHYNQITLEMKMGDAPIQISVGDKFLFNADVKCERTSRGSDTIARIGQCVAYNAFLAQLIAVFAANGEDILRNTPIPGILVEVNRITYFETEYNTKWLKAFVCDDFSNILADEYPKTIIYSSSLNKNKADEITVGKAEGFDASVEESLLRIAFVIHEKITKKTSNGEYSDYLKAMPSETELMRRKLNPRTQSLLTQSSFIE